LSDLSVNPVVSRLDIPEEIVSDVEPVRPARDRHASTWMNDYEVSLLSSLYKDKPQSYKEAIKEPNKV
jgi:hypothetical protein